MPEDDIDPPPVCPGGLIVLERTPSGVAFRPSRGRGARAGRAGGATAVACPLVLAGGGYFFGPPWATSAGGLLALAVGGAFVSGCVAIGMARYRTSAATPLLAEWTGRVSYGPRVLLEPGARPRFSVEERRPDAEERSRPTYRVVASNRWGPVVRFPDPWFDEFDDWAAAEWFARRLAAVVGDVEPSGAPDDRA
jgi:hypothetical protein